MKVHIFGHRNPDSDSILSAIALVNLKKHLGTDAIGYRLGDINRETRYVLERFNLKEPKLIENVKIQLLDIEYEDTPTLCIYDSIKKAYDIMKSYKIRQLAIVNKERALQGIVSINDIAMASIEENYYNISTNMDNLLGTLSGTIINGEKGFVEGKIPIIPSYYSLLEDKNFSLEDDSIVILPDVHEMIEKAIEMKPRLVVVTAGGELPGKILKKAKKHDVSIITTPFDIYKSSKLITQSNFISSIMISKGIIRFDETEYLEDVKEAIQDKPHVQFPVVNENNVCLGFISMKHLMYPNRKRVLLVDHNEYAQTAEGIEEAEILEIVDHHKIGGLQTTSPIEFINRPVGSTCTIVYDLYIKNNIDIEENIAGALLSGILSDTLMLKSPTTTSQDIETVEKLSAYLGLDYREYSMEMFRESSRLETADPKVLLSKDYKEFKMENSSVGISQLFTLDFDEIKKLEDEIIDILAKEREKRSLDISLLLVTDIVNNGSYVYYSSKYHTLLREAFEREISQGSFLEDIVSRKKQILPKLIRTLEYIK